MQQYELDADIALERVDTNRFRGVVTDRWNTIGQPNGGYLVGIALNAARASLPHPDPISTTTHFVRPAANAPCEVVVDVIRTGKTISTAAVSIFQNEKETLRLLGSFADLTGSESPRVRTITPPPALPFDELPDLGTPNSRAVNIGARYAHRLEPSALGYMRGEPSGRMEKIGYLRFRDGRPPCTLSLPVLADALPPSIGNVVSSGFTPTIELTVHVRAIPADGPILARFVTRELSNGYFEEDGDLWDDRGELVAMSRQLLKYYGPSK